MRGCASDTEGSEDAIDDLQAVGDALEVANLNVKDVSPDEEYIVLENTADEPVDLSGFELRDREGGQVDGGLSPFSFPDEFVLEPGETARITTGEGDSTETELYWGYNVNIWRGDGDVVRLVDANDQVVLEHAYGDIDLEESTAILWYEPMVRRSQWRRASRSRRMPRISSRKRPNPTTRRTH
ncbi:lamin tail domain-containing protein [Halosolutus halophilus]|uniref:lamin tail domain-containing protein n=1 Tax=Halosolutus halophilus TaxID=1552990 RepID=UPI00223501A1|nr:lamin tail domain-containing protein [Halosolutus halophilus]